MTSDRLRIVSHYPGRLRARAAAFREGDAGERVAEALRGDPGVTTASATALTGSVLVEYDAKQVQLPWLVQRIVQLGGLAGIAADHHGGAPRFTGPAIRDRLSRWNGAILDASRGRVDPRAVVPGTLAGLGIVTLLFGQRALPRWYDLLFWSYVTFHNSNAHLPTEPSGEPT